ncbi:uncharacterized protein DDB_G0283357 isoform X2 [Hydra vulgaris]|uniref:Uncharacterized protein DDB_G0283357 isoform X2 n=1 Tax=Hydra vulgaris TaxID=6087 RepID=A0ABM4BLL7_HYDVU
MVKQIFILKKVFYDDDAIDAYSDQITHYNNNRAKYSHRKGRNEYRNRSWDSRIIEEMQRNDRKYIRSERSTHVRIPVEISYKKYNKAHKSKSTNVLKHCNEKDILPPRKNMWLYDELAFEKVPSSKFTDLSINHGNYSPVDRRLISSSNDDSYIRSGVSKNYVVNSNRSLKNYYYDKDDSFNEKFSTNGNARNSFNQNNFLNLPKPPDESLGNKLNSSFQSTDKINTTEYNFMNKGNEDKRRTEINTLEADDFVDNKIKHSSRKDRNETSKHFYKESLTNNNSTHRIKHYNTNVEPGSFNFRNENNAQKQSLSLDNKSLSLDNKNLMSQEKCYNNEDVDRDFFYSKNFNTVSSDSRQNDRLQQNCSKDDNFRYDSQQFDNSQNDNLQYSSRSQDNQWNEYQIESSESISNILFNQNKKQLNENIHDVNEKQDDLMYSVVSKPTSVYKSKRNSSLNKSQNKTEEEKINKNEISNANIYQDFNEEKKKNVQPRKYNVTWQNTPGYDSERKQSLETISEKSFQNQNPENEKSPKRFVSNIPGNSIDDNLDADENALHLRRIYGNESIPYSLSRSDENSIYISKTSIDKDGSTTNNNELNQKVPNSYQENKKISDENEVSKKLSKNSSGEEKKTSRKSSISAFFNFSKPRDSKDATSNGNESYDSKGSISKNSKRSSKSSIFSRKKSHDSKSSVSNDENLPDWKNQSFNGNKSGDSESSTFIGNKLREEGGTANSSTDDQSEHENSIDSNDECPEGRVLRNGRRESYRDLANRIKENTVYPTPTFSRFEVLPNTELSLCKLKPDHPPMFINRSCEQGIFVGDQGIQKDAVKSGAYAAIYCKNCKQFVNKECGPDCKGLDYQDSVGKRQ